MEDVNLLKRKLERERLARKHAEQILETKALELFQANSSLKKLNENLEDQILQRTKDLRKSESKYRIVINNASDIIYTTDADGIFTFINPIGIDSFGFTKEEIIGKQFANFVLQSHRKELLAYYIALKENKIQNNYHEFPIRSKSGEVHWIGQNVNRMDKPNGDVFFNAVARDITLRKQTEKELEKARQKAIKAQYAEQQFLANMSHEIRTPLNAIIGMSHLLKDSELDEKQREYVDILGDSAGLLKGLVSDILDISKIDAGQADKNESAFDLSRLAIKLNKTFSNKASEKGIELNYDISSILDCIVQSDKQWLNQILINLLSNAIKFTNEGEVTLSIKKLKENVDSSLYHFEVSDTGVGIKEENVDKVFSAFKQANAAVRTEFGGTGLGLSIASKLVALLGGKLKLKSEFGVGSQFYFELEIKNSEKTLDAVKTIQDYGTSMVENLKVLVVEDNLMNQKYILTLLKKWNINSDLANNGQEAVEQFEANDYDMIFMDLSMPIMDGYEATRLIRSSTKTQIPIIALTASTFLSKKQLALKSGMSDFLAKPFTPEDLSTMIQKYTKSKPIKSTSTTSVFEFNKVLDRQALAKIYSNDYAYCLDMFNTYLEILDDEILQLRHAFENENRIDLKKQAHKIKPIFSMVGLSSLSKQCAQLEQKTESAEWSELKVVYDSLTDKVWQTKSIIEAEAISLKNYLEIKT